MITLTDTTISVYADIKVKGAAPIPPIQHFTGTIISNPSWVRNDSICLTTGETRFPFRIIPKKDIVKSSVAINYSKPSSDKNIFLVRGSKGQEYTITRKSDHWNCTCVGFEFRHACKHVAAAKKLLLNNSK